MEQNRKSIQIKRRCPYCKKDFYINRNNVSEAIYYKKRTYHDGCWQKKYADKSDDNAFSALQKESCKHFSDEIAKKEVVRFIFSAYDIKTIPTNVWSKLNAFYTGEYPGMSVCIPPEHLYDMWQRKIGLLNKIADSNKSKGKHVAQGLRINYDLSVLLNKYDSYLNWLEKQKILEAEARKKIKDDKLRMDMNIFISKSKEKDCKAMDDSLEDLVDDIFEDGLG